MKTPTIFAQSLSIYVSAFLNFRLKSHHQMKYRVPVFSRHRDPSSVLLVREPSTSAYDHWSSMKVLLVTGGTGKEDVHSSVIMQIERNIFRRIGSHTFNSTIKGSNTIG